MKNPALDGARAKIDRAVHHLREIDDAIGKLWAAETKNVSTAPPRHKMEGNHLVVFRQHSAPVDPSFSLSVGDFIHNTRSSLDHLVYQLALLNNAPAKAAAKSSFPIHLTHGKFQNATAEKVAPFINPTALADIEKLQPYSTGKREEDILWILSQLDIIDKHRLLIVTKSKVRPVQFKITLPDGRVASDSLPDGEWKPSETGTEFIRFDLSGISTTPGDMKVEIGAAMTVQIEKSGLSCDGRIIQLVLQDCINYAVAIVNAFGKKFFSE